MDADSVKVIRRYDASDGALGAIAEAEGGAHDFGHDEGVDQGAVFLQVEQIGPGDPRRAGLATRGSRKGGEPLLVRDQRVRSEEDSFDPTEHGGVGADSEREAKNRQRGKAGTAAKHAQPKAKVLQSAFNHGQPSLFAIDLLGLLET